MKVNVELLPSGNWYLRRYRNGRVAILEPVEMRRIFGVPTERPLHRAYDKKGKPIEVNLEMEIIG